MKPPSRWPLHPAPLAGEALSSWLCRIAQCYQMDVSDLLQHDLGHDQVHDLDICPPAALLDTLARRTGVELDLLRGMSLAGWMPWLLDDLNSDSSASAFDTYVHQLSVLLPLSKRPVRIVPNWKAWLPKRAIHRACPECLNEDGKYALLLIWQLPLLLSCPQHGCWLEPYLGVPGNFLLWEAEEVQSRQANELIAKMDHRTWQALTTGHVELPLRCVHVGIWLRLLRTLLDELSSPISHTPSQAQDIRKIWESCGYPVRARQNNWHPYETLDMPVQLQMLEAVATTIQLIETGTLTARGTQAELFLPVPTQEIADGCQASKQPGEKVNHWQVASAAMDKAIANARQHPEEAQALFNLALFGRKDAESIRQTQAMLTDLGVPSDWYHI